MHRTGENFLHRILFLDKRWHLHQSKTHMIYGIFEKNSIKVPPAIDLTTCEVDCWREYHWGISHSEMWISFDNVNRTCFIYTYDLLSIKTILFDILDFWCQLEEIRFVKRLSKRRMFVSFMKISACWLLHRFIKFNRICWEKRPAKPRPNLRTLFWRRDLKNNQPHLNRFARQFMGSFLGRITGVIKYRTEQVSNKVNRACFEQWVARRLRKAPIRLWCFGKPKMFLLYPSVTFCQVQEDCELAKENPPGTNLVVLRSTPQ